MESKLLYEFIYSSIFMPDGLCLPFVLVSWFTFSSVTILTNLDMKKLNGGTLETVLSYLNFRLFSTLTESDIFFSCFDE